MDLSDVWDYIEHTAEERLKHNISPRHVADYGTSIEVIGAAGELAARRFFSMDEGLHTHFDGGADLNYRGYRIDVKATVWTKQVEHRFLQWPYWKRVKADLILLTAVDTDRKAAIILGYANKSDILNAPVNLTRHTPCHEIPVSELIPAGELLHLTYVPKTHAFA